ncbi:MAG: YeeE/YedE thiosulfate transporter family protein, partial [Hyphomicrobiaceae bacterium]
MQMRNFIMLKVFLSAIATGLVVLAVLNGIFDVKLHPKAFNLEANAVGGALLGIGIVLAGACPGTVAAQIGAGYKDAWFTAIGALFGALTFGYLHAAIKPVLLSNSYGKITFADVTGIAFWGLALVVTCLICLALLALELKKPWFDELGSDLDGDLGGDNSSHRDADHPANISPAE